MLVFLLAVLSCCVFGQTSTSNSVLIADLQKALDAEVTANPSLPGEFLHIIYPSRNLNTSFASGMFDRESKRPLDPHNTFRVASVTKTFVATSILKLIEDGKLGLEDHISKHLPKEYIELLKNDGYEIDKITIRRLLTHTSGIHDYANDRKYYAAVMADPGHRWTRLEQLKSALEWGAPHFAPGEGFHYSDTGYILLGEILERITKLSLDKALRTLVDFQKLGLDETYLESLEPAPATAKPIAHPFYQQLDAMMIDASHDLYGGGGIVSTVEDLSLFFRALFQKKVFKKETTLNEMLTIPNKSDTGLGGRYAMGIHKNSINGFECWGHTGFWGTSVYHCPTQDLTIARHYNQAEPEDTFIFAALYRRIFEIAVQPSAN